MIEEQVQRTKKLFLGIRIRKLGAAPGCNQLSAQLSGLDYEAQIEQTLDALADHVEAHLDLDALLALAR